MAESNLEKQAPTLNKMKQTSLESQNLPTLNTPSSNGLMNQELPKTMCSCGCVSAYWT